LKNNRDLNSIVVMKKQISLALVVVGVALFTGCAMFQESGQSALVGTWTNPLGTVWAIKADGTMQVSLHKNRHVDVSGTYTVTGDTLNLQQTHGGPGPKSCRGPATYKFQRNGDMLTFTKVSDQCKLREKNILAGWTPWKGK
jgi:Family of unknown function (DUF5640)